MQRSPFDDADDYADRDTKSVMFVVTALVAVMVFAFWMAFGK